MNEGRKLTVRGQAAERCGFPGHCVPCDTVEDARVEHKETTVDLPAVTGRLLFETLNAVPIQDSRTVSPWRRHRGQCRLEAVAAVEFDQCADVDVRNAVAIGHAEGLVAQQMTDALQTATGHRLGACVHQGHAPGRNLLFSVEGNPVFSEIHRHIRTVQHEVREIFFDEIALVAEADDELVEAVVAVEHHDVPEDWLPADLDHRLGTKVRFLGDSRPQAAGEQNDLHSSLQSGAISVW